MNIQRDAFFTVFNQKKQKVLDEKQDKNSAQHSASPFRMRSYTTEPYGETFSRNLYGHYKPRS